MTIKSAEYLRSAQNQVNPDYILSTKQNSQVSPQTLNSANPNNNDEAQQRFPLLK